MDRAEVGRRGEAVAARFYQKQGCLLVAHNYSLLVGEIDLILREPDGTLVFCEVKTRQPDSLTTPAEAVTPAKQRRILRTAQLCRIVLGGDFSDFVTRWHPMGR